VTTGESRCRAQLNFFVNNKTVGLIVKDNCENDVKHNVFCLPDEKSGDGAMLEKGKET